MSKFIMRFLATLGVMALILVVTMAFAVFKTGKVPEKTILEANFYEAFSEEAPQDPIAQLLSVNQLSLRDVVDAIDKGAKDDRVVGMIARISAAPLGMAQAQEIRDAVARFRAQKKFAVAYSETFGEFGPGNSAYYLASAFEKIYLQPSGDVGLTGVMMQSAFVKGTLDKLGVVYRGDHRYEYKNALNFYTDSKYTAAQKEATTAIVSSWFNQMKEGICAGRGIAPENFESLVDAGPYLGTEAVAAKLVDELAYRDEVYLETKERAGEGAELLYLDRYLERAGRPHDKGETIALVYGVGAVTRGENTYDPLSGSQTMGSDTVASAIRSAAEDEDVRAIVFRVDSPGGSYVASDTIWREVVRAKRAGKPVIVTMGNVAGSGGYFVAMAADKIVAQPGTITASIGVLGGKLLMQGLFDKLGLSFDEVHQGKNATMFTTTQDFTPAEWARFEAWLDRVYVDFTNKVAEGRKLPKEKVLQIAKGRIWSGQDAKELGLVDELGGYETAFKFAKQAAKIPETEDVSIVVYPRPKSFFESIMNRGADSSDEEGMKLAFTKILSVVQPMFRQLDALGITGRREGKEDVLRVPAI